MPSSDNGSHDETHDNYYESRTRTEDLPVSKTLRKRLHSAIEELKKRGFKYSMKFGGVRLNPESGEREYCRWEVFKATPWKIDEVFHMSRYFHDRYRRENLGVYYVTVKDGHDKLLRYRLSSRKRKDVSL